MQNHGLFLLFYWEALACNTVPDSSPDRIFLIIAEYLCLFPCQTSQNGLYWLKLNNTTESLIFKIKFFSYSDPLHESMSIQNKNMSFWLHYSPIERLFSKMGIGIRVDFIKWKFFTFWKIPSEISNTDKILLFKADHKERRLSRTTTANKFLVSSWSTRRGIITCLL